jgi:hypothetical protein
MHIDDFSIKPHTYRSENTLFPFLSSGCNSPVEKVERIFIYARAFSFRCAAEKVQPAFPGTKHECFQTRETVCAAIRAARTIFQRGGSLCCFLLIRTRCTLWLQAHTQIHPAFNKCLHITRDLIVPMELVGFSARSSGREESACSSCVLRR